jgi:hypothetical protein
VSRLRRARGVAEQAEPKRPGLRTADILALTAVCIATALGFAGVADNELLNWDDQAALVKNTALDGDGVAGWAFSTTHMAHYQPLSWLAWALTRRAFGPAPAVHHLLSLALHLANAALVFVLAFGLASLTKLGAAPRRVAALSAAILFAAHPLRVEPVAWASGLPYVLALTPLLLSVILYVRHATASGVGTLLLGSWSRSCRSPSSPRRQPWPRARRAASRRSSAWALPSGPPRRRWRPSSISIERSGPEA